MTVYEFAEALTEKFAGEEHKFALRNFRVQSVGRKYTRIVQSPDGEPFDMTTSVHCFVENETGHVYKAASWKAPASGVRFTSMEAAVEAADVHGGYLYAGRA